MLRIMIVATVTAGTYFVLAALFPGGGFCADAATVPTVPGRTRSIAELVNSTFTAGGSFQNNTKCAEEGDILGTNEALEAAKPKTRCVTQPQNASVCSVDFRLESEMRRICEAANGKLWERSIILECYLNNSGTESAETTSDDTKMLFHYYNIPTCLGMSCDVTVAENEFDAFVPGDFEQNLLEERNLTCSARAEPASASSAPSWNQNKWRWNTIHVSALGVVGFWYWTLL